MSDCPFCSKPLSALPRLAGRPILSACHACMNPLMLRYDGASWVAAAPPGIQDIRLKAQPGSMGGELLKLLPKAIEQLPILPEIAHQILMLLHNTEARMQDLTDLINKDPVIALKILRLANSPVYGGLIEIKDLRGACTRLGMHVIANAVQAVANGHIYCTKNPRYAGVMEKLWQHAVATAQCASDIAVLMAEPCPDVLFVAGLVHDVGKVLLLDLVAKHPNSPAMKQLAESQDHFAEMMIEYHALLGLHIVQRWNLPPEFGVTTFCHGQIGAAPDNSWLPMINTVALASAIATRSGFGISEPAASLSSHPATKFLGLNNDKIDALRIDLEDKIAPLLEITQLPG